MTLTTLMVLTNINGQITTKSVADKKEPETTPYDSTRNFVGEDVRQYIGQELYLKPKSESSRKYGYRGFIKDYKKSLRVLILDKDSAGLMDYMKSVLNKSNVYKCCDSYNSKYDDLSGRYFKVIDVHKYPKAGDYLYSYPYGKEFYLQLEDKETKETCYYEYDSRSEYFFPFIIVGYWEKYKNDNIGKQFVIRYLEDELLDVNTGEQVEFTNGSTWKCTELTIEEKYYIMVLIFENDKGQQIKSNGNKGTLYYWEKSVADKYKGKFGSYWTTILEGKVKIGMTEEMVRLSWGDPDKINKASYGDQWVYGNQYLYFENGMLKSFN